MSKKAIVIADHKLKTATLNFVDEENNLYATDYKGQPLVGMSFPYSNITNYEFMFESLGMIDNDSEKFEFKINVG
jgi:hypothetical protein